jgi:1,4-alpha-glucan branching enzyme
MENMLKKRRLSQGKGYEVTFILPPAINAKSVMLVGDFNNWDKDATPMSQAKDGSWQVKVKLEPKQEFQYRYYVNGSEWHNDWEADKYVMHPYGGENSVVVT